VSRLPLPFAAAPEPAGDRCEDTRAAEVRLCLGQIAELFHSQFEQNWLLLLLERYPMDAVAMNEVRGLMRRDAASLEPARLAEGLAVLEGYTRHLRRCLLPGLREKLGVSGLLPDARRVWGREQLLLRGLVAYTFPFNLGRLERLASRLKRALEGFEDAASA
jgi:hypothetical protein